MTQSPTHVPESEPLTGRDILCFSHDWSGDPLSKTHLMRLLSRENRILWVNSIGYRAPTASRRDLSRAVRKVLAAAGPLRELEPNIHVLNPLVIPAHGRPWAARFNRWFLREQVRRAMRRLSFRRPINWVFNPAAALVAGTLGEDLLIYHCVDEYTAFSGVARDALAELESGLLARADLVIASSERLCETKQGSSGRARLVRHGVDWAHFRGALDRAGPVPAELAGLPRPIIGYFGLIADDWIDLPLLVHLARSFPHASIVMLGRVTMDVSIVRQFPNVHFPGRQPYARLPDFCRAFKAAIIPFPISEVTLSANPLKAREYLAAGVPVVSTAIPEVEALGLCRTARDADAFVRELEQALAEPGPSRGRSDAVRTQSWDARLDEIKHHIAETIDARAPIKLPRSGHALAA
jgi:glycosyltransferase involved in cell wall biosynthesis